MADMKGLSGSIVALVTPFAEDGSVDFGGAGRLVDFHLENGTDALLTLGTTGESSTMSHARKTTRWCSSSIAWRTRARYRGKRLEQYAQTMLEKSLSFQKMGADGLLLITPYYNKSNERGHLPSFHPRVLDAVDIPCILYNVPGRGVLYFPEECRAPGEASQRIKEGFRAILAMGGKSRATCPMISHVLGQR